MTTQLDIFGGETRLDRDPWQLIGSEWCHRSQPWTVVEMPIFGTWAWSTQWEQGQCDTREAAQLACMGAPSDTPSLF